MDIVKTKMNNRLKNTGPNFTWFLEKWPPLSRKGLLKPLKSLDTPTTTSQKPDFRYFRLKNKKLLFI